jgi:hypothetical protein
MTSLTDFQIQYTKYKWEFLRRNPEYLQEWQQLQNVLEQEYGDWRPPDDRPTHEEGHFCLKWKLGNPLNPEMSYDDYTKFSLSPLGNGGMEMDRDEAVLMKPIDFHRIMLEWVNPQLLYEIPLRIVDGLNYKIDESDHSIGRYVSNEFAETGKLAIEIDLNYSKNRLIKEYKILLDESKILYDDSHKKKHFFEYCKEKNIRWNPFDKYLMKEFEKEYKKKLKQRRQKYEKKYHFDNFDDYLKVYDLRKKKVSWANITKKLELNSIQTARNHYKSACEIIEKGIELYVK